MNSRERVLSAINLQSVDRIPTDILATPDVEALVRKSGYTYSRTVKKSLSVFPVENPMALKVSVLFKEVGFWDEFERVKKTGGVFCLWGHGHEIKDEKSRRNWRIKFNASTPNRRLCVTNADLFKAVG
jgi:hypothetical protein